MSNNYYNRAQNEYQQEEQPERSSFRGPPRHQQGYGNYQREDGYDRRSNNSSRNNNFRGGKSSFRGRGGFGNKQNRNKGPKATGLEASAGPRVSKENFPKPSNPSKTSKDKNDVLSDFPQISNLAISTECRVRPKFKVDCSQIMQIIKASYNQMIPKEKQYRQRISESMYVYYIVIQLWRSYIYSSTSYDPSNQAEVNAFNNFMDANSTPIPPDVKLFFTGLGDFVDKQGHEVKMIPYKLLSSSPLINGAAGHYGKVCANNHLAYETMPSPFVCLKRIAEDLRYTLDGGSPDWDLPDRLKPDVESGYTAHPTANLLGWAPAVKLTTEQMTVLSASSFTTANYGIEEHRMGLPLNRGLIERVADSLNSLISVEGAKAFERTIEGSQAQLPFCKVDPDDMLFDQYRVFCSRRMVTLHYDTLGESIVYAANAFRYRQKRKTEDTSAISLCYFKTKPAPAAPVVLREQAAGTSSTVSGEAPESQEDQDQVDDDNYEEEERDVIEEEDDPPPIIEPMTGWITNSDDIYRSVPEGWNYHGYTTCYTNGAEIARTMAETFVKKLDLSKVVNT